MPRNYKLLLFYTIAVLVAADLYVVVGRLFINAPDPVAWEKVALSAILQAATISITASYLRWLSRAKRSLIPEHRSVFSFDVALVPIIAAGLVAAVSVLILTNATNCGNHPLPTNRGQRTCPN